jgi:hypothetical protein
MPCNYANKDQWAAAGYCRDVASAIARLPPPSHLRPLYHLTTADHAINDIALGRLKVARFSDLNDPFELISVHFREQQVRKVVREFRDAYNAHTGLLCFSADWADPVLWSHYATKHRGICLGFNVPRDSVEEVEYEDQRPLANLPDDGSPLQMDEKLQKKLLCTKYKHWAYEKEYRRFIQLQDATQEERLHFVNFGPDLELAEVVLGPQCVAPLDTVRALVSSKYPHVITYRARLAFKYFHVVPQECTVP